MDDKGLKTTAVNLQHYRGGWGQWAWIFHRLAGLGVVLFLLLHILDTASVHFAPAEYNFFVRLYKSPLFGLAEVGLAAALIYHAINGLRLIVLDFWPKLWEHQEAAQRIVWLAFVLIFAPVAGVMLLRLINHYAAPSIR